MVERLHRLLVEGGVRLRRITGFPRVAWLGDPLPAASAAAVLRRARDAAQGAEQATVVAMGRDAALSWRDVVGTTGTRWLEAAARVLEAQSVEEAAAQFFRQRQQLIRALPEPYRRDLRRQLGEVEALAELPERPPAARWQWPASGAEMHLVLIGCEAGMAPLYLGFGGFDRCPLPVEHAVVQRHWHRLYGAEPVHIGRDTLELDVSRPPRTIDALREAVWHSFLYSRLEVPAPEPLLTWAAELQQHTWVYRWG